MRIFRNRICKPSDKWVFLRWYDIVLDDELYLSRLNIIKTPWFSVKLHWIHRPDPDRDLHNHPWRFIAFILRGSYEELESKNPTREPGKLRKVNWLNYKNNVTAHRITKVTPNVLTLVISGPKNYKKDWGFYDVDTLEFIHWRTYEENKL